ncbi:peptidase M23-like protein [Litoreibacter meonggei]|uniref:Peptidase M23-like protein n=1 Tax=Litoreibacter meonggei TaxID=1049199 RepID=A0A497X5S1_9RHOB|nr:M23 family metallopeptidase [Litoreibacter meonggei]RLJ60658.1 peptidase M23-like protein [Litoreibacter meonggei]
MRAALLALTLTTFAAPAAAKDPLFSLPIDCDLGKTCFIQNYVDSDPSTGARDHTCGPLTYDGHKGTDIRVATLAEMDVGVTVLASASGTIRATRDGMADIPSNAPNAPHLDGKNCGNGLVIDHGGGWETQYCHMRNGSLVVEKGARVAKGAKLGLVGLSGKTVFPHIHMSLRHNGKVVDPFAPDANGTCGPSENTLWEEDVSYQAGALLDAGFADGVPEFSNIKAGLLDPTSLSPDAAGLVLWGYAFGTRAGDTMEFKIAGPEDWRHDQIVEFTKPQAQVFRASGRKRPANGWPEGNYEGSVTFSRDGTVLSSLRLSVIISR